MSSSILGLEVGVEFRGFEPGAFLDDMREFAVAHDAGVGIFLGQVLQEFVHSMLLGFGTGIGSVAFIVDTSFVADADRAVVIVSGVGATCRLWQQGNYAAIQTDIIVITYLAEFCLACCNQVLHTEWAVTACGTAMHNQEFYCVVI